MLAALRLVLFAALAPAPLLGQAPHVWVVDDDHGPGVDFATLQAAIDAASSGDVVLVKDGTYTDFALDAKSLAIAAELAASVVIRSSSGSASSVRNVALGQSVVLRGLTFHDHAGTRLRIEQCPGSVWVEACKSTGSFQFFTLQDAIAVHDAASVKFERCALTGGAGGFFVALQSALASTNSNVNLHDCACLGGAGASVGLGGQPGGAGVTVNGGTLFASGCTILGGAGGDNSPAPFQHCTPPGAGGHGLVVDGGADVRLLDTQVQGGTGGAAPCEVGPSGVATKLNSGTLTPVSGLARGVASTSPVREGQVMRLSFDAQAGDLVFYGFSAGPSDVWLPSLYGVVLLDAPIAVGFVGLQSSAQALSALIAVPDLGSDLARETQFQCGVLDAQGEIRLGAATSVLLLDASL